MCFFNHQPKTKTILVIFLRETCSSLTESTARLIFSFSFTASVRSVNTPLTCCSPELWSISFNQWVVGNRLRIKWSDWSVVSWFWHLQHQEFSSKKLAVTTAWRESVLLLKHLDEQRAPTDPARLWTADQTLNYCWFIHSQFSHSILHIWTTNLLWFNAGRTEIAETVRAIIQYGCQVACIAIES